MGHLVRHISRHKTHFCDHCPFTATSKSQLKDHKKDTHEWSYNDKKILHQCKKCPFKSKTKEELKEHAKNMHLECKLKFNRHEKFKYSIEKASEKIHKCVQKNSGTAEEQKVHLNNHIDSTHHREDNVTYDQWGGKTFKCDHCPLTYVKKGVLLRHIKKCHEKGQNP